MMPLANSSRASMRAADSNVIIRLIAQDDPEQLALARNALVAGLWISHVVLVEVIWVLRKIYRLDRAQLEIVVSGLLTNAQVTIQEPDVVSSALREFGAGGGGSDFPDCLI